MVFDMGQDLSKIKASPVGLPIEGNKNLAIDHKRHVHHCVTMIDVDGSVSYYDRDNPDILIAKIRQGFEYYDIEDFRNPPFYQILPCPYCGVSEDKNHDDSLHIYRKDPKTEGAVRVKDVMVTLAAAREVFSPK